MQPASARTPPKSLLLNGREAALSGLSQIVQEDLCHRCGTCEAVCGAGAIERDSAGFPRIAAGRCVGCLKCVQVCPGAAFDFSRASQSLFGLEFDPEDGHGHYKAGFLGYASNSSIREQGCSGGVVTALLMHLLESGFVDGVLVTVDESAGSWRPKGVIARTAQEITSASGSRYAVNSLNTALAEIRRLPGRYAIVGLPCHIHGVRNAAAQDRLVRERVVFTIGLLCHASLEPELLEFIENKRAACGGAKAKKFYYRLGKHSGMPMLEFEDGRREHVLFPWACGYRPTALEALNVLFCLYTPRRCITCFDATAEVADVSMGDPWIRRKLQSEVDLWQGYTFALARTDVGLRALQEAASKRCIALIRLADDEIKACNRTMILEKKRRAFAFMARRAAAGQRNPDYSCSIPAPVTGLSMRLHLFSYQLCFSTSLRRIILKLLLSRLGYLLFFTLHVRRRLRRMFNRRYLADTAFSAVRGPDGKPSFTDA